MVMALGAAVGFALGTVLAKKRPILMRPIPAAAWQIGIGSLPVVAAGFLIETTHLSNVSALGWWLLVYSTVGAFSLAYVCWFAALARLPASVATIGTMAAPVIGVVTSALALGEPLGPGQLTALIFTLGGVALATR
jgi:drug/metabolite transporter (DMT)-like permease